MQPLTFPLPEEKIEQVLAILRFNADGLLPAVAQDVATKQVLMVAMMSAQSVRATLTEGRAVYYSRSRQALWRKGDTSGHTQTVQHFYYDCDADTILMQVQQVGAACHTGAVSCFFTAVTAV
jgi:phosphoribosyl-AMP cyclohydrolase